MIKPVRSSISLSIISCFCFLFSLQTLKAQGLSGYIVSVTKQNSYPPGYDMGLGFYSAVWRFTPEPLQSLQVGLPSTWIVPNNSDNTTEPLCPVGTVARDFWPERGPTYASVFQTMEGGLGFWGGNRFQYGFPKFMMNGVPNCYNYQIGTPGWSFFSGSNPLPDNQLGIAQLSNRLIFPPDGMPFEGAPHGEFLGYSYLALPLTEPHEVPQPTGTNYWTLFFNAKNFKGPVAFFVPETWSKISNGYPFDNGRGLDSRGTLTGQAPTMEVATVPSVAEVADNGVTYTKSAQVQFPVDQNGQTILYRELAYYSKDALYNDVLSWKNGGSMPSGTFNQAGVAFPELDVVPYEWFGMNGKPIENAKMKTMVTNGAFGLSWTGNMENGFGKLPLYYRDEPTKSVAISESELPAELTIKDKVFAKPDQQPVAYFAELTGAWAEPGPTAGPFTAILVDGSKVTYFWYRFVDQPVFHQYNWTEEEKNKLQTLVEQIHSEWTMDKNYMHPNSSGELVSLDKNLIVNPPPGLETGYVPIVTWQSLSSDIDCSQVNMSITSTVKPSPDSGFEAELHLSEFEGEAKVKWSNGHTGLSTSLEEDETYHAVITIGNWNCTFYHYSPPIALPAKGLDALSFYASWKSVPGAKGYLIDVASDTDFANKLDGWDSKPVEGSTKIPIPLVNGVNDYYYRVRSNGFLDEVSEYSNVVALHIADADCNLDIEISKVNISNPVESNGQATAIVKGGQSPYNYDWSNGATTAQISNLGIGNYELTVTDALGCASTSEVQIGLPVGTNSIGNRVWHDLNRNGFDDFDEPGIAGVNVGIWRDADGDGIPEEWMGYKTTDENGHYLFTDLAPGVYATFVWEIGNWEQGNALYRMTNTNGNYDPNNDVDGDDNGERLINNIASKPIVITADGEPLLDGDRQSGEFDYDPSGNMTIDFGFYSLDDPCPVINMEMRTTYDSQSDCSLTAFPASGVGPFQYAWSNGATSQSISSPDTGSHKVTITDRNGCVGTYNFSIDNCRITCTNDEVTDNVVACNSFIWIDGNTYTSSNNTATFTLTNKAGCDSTVYLKLTIFAMEAGLTTIGTTLISNAAVGASFKWFNCDNGEYIPNATGQSFQPTTSGNYGVEVSLDGCTGLSECQSVTITSIPENINSEFKVHPNPTTDNITVSFPPNVDGAELRLVNKLGQTILVRDLNGQNTTDLKIEGGSGLYFLVLKTRDGKSNFMKVIKN